MRHSLLPFSFLALLAVVGWAYPSVSDFDWTSIIPTWELQYRPCYEEYQCARLLMPLDWLDDSPHISERPTVALAIISLPASSVSTGDTRHGGSVLVNPGGPGDSGVVHILRNGHYIRSMVDTPGERYFDVISFDPRGMANSIPIADCFENEAIRALWDAQDLGVSLTDKWTNATLRRSIARATALGKKCQGTSSHRDAIQEHMSTASVARDMLRMVEEIDNLESRLKEDLLPHNTGSQEAFDGEVSVVDNKRPNKVPRIQYYGTSYGTMLGNTFISMFPGRVKRMVLDGLVVPEDYIAGDWCGNLEDTTATLDYFYETCFSAGPSKCDLVRSSDHRWQDLRDRVNTLVENLDETPVPVAVVGHVPRILEGKDIIARMMDPIYNPLDLFPGLAKTLSHAIEGNYSSLLRDMHILDTNTSDRDQACRTAPKSDYRWMSLSGTAVRCGDGEDMRARSLDWWQEMRDKCISNSPVIGRLWMSTECAGWQVRPKDRFTGPFTSPAANVDDVDGRPSAPVLLLSSRHDPVTPLHSARRVSKSHPGSRVVIQDSVGHCVLLSAPGECAKKVMRRYMLTGEVPQDQETLCKADCKVWESCNQPRAVLPRD